jgi:YtcA family
MTGTRKALSVFTIAAFSLFLSGCSGAPSVDIIGSFFPAWMICMVIAVVGTFAVRYVLVKLHLESEVGPLALFYPSLLTLLTCLIWLGNFR